MKRPTEAEYQLISAAAVERLGEDGSRLLTAIFEVSFQQNWGIRELHDHLQGVEAVVGGLIAGWIDPPSNDEDSPA